jgi:hypothetical protein
LANDAGLRRQMSQGEDKDINPRVRKFHFSHVPRP